MCGNDFCARHVFHDHSHNADVYLPHTWSQTWGDIDPGQILRSQRAFIRNIAASHKAIAGSRADCGAAVRNIVSPLTAVLLFVGTSPACAKLLSQTSISCNLPYELWMTTDKIYVDASQPAILRHLGGTFACPTLGAAMIAWDELPDKGDATIQIGGQTYTANEIARFEYGPNPRR